MSLESEVTKLVRNVTQAFGANHPIRFGISVFGGVSLKGIASICAAEYPDIAWLSAAGQTNVIFFVAFILVFSFATLRLFGDPLVSESFAAYLRGIEEMMDKAGFDEAEKRERWRALYSRYTKNFPDVDKSIQSLAADSIKASEAESELES